MWWSWLVVRIDKPLPLLPYGTICYPSHMPYLANYGHHGTGMRYVFILPPRHILKVLCASSCNIRYLSSDEDDQAACAASSTLLVALSNARR